MTDSSCLDDLHRHIFVHQGTLRVSEGFQTASCFRIQLHTSRRWPMDDLLLLLYTYTSLASCIFRQE